MRIIILRKNYEEYLIVINSISVLNNKKEAVGVPIFKG